MSHNWLNVRRMARGGFSFTTFTNLGTLALFNNGQGAEMIAVWAWQAAQNTTTTLGLGIAQGSVGGTALTAQPCVTGGMLGPGTLTKLDTATSYALDWLSPFGVIGAPYLQASFPYCVLQPGWSCIIQDQHTGDSVAMSIYWEWLHPEDLEGRKCAKCYLSGVA